MVYDINFIKDIVDIVLTLVLVIATVYLAIYTYRLVDESRKARMAQVQPVISLYLEHAETDPTLLFIIMKNIGRGTAYDLRFDIKKDLGDYGSEGRKIQERGLFKEGMKFCPPEYYKKYFLVETVNKYEEKMKEELIVVAHYKTVFNQDIREVFYIRLKEQAMASLINPPDTYIGRIAESLKEIKELMRNK